MSNVSNALDLTLLIVQQREAQYNAITPIQKILETPERTLDLAQLKLNRAKGQLAQWVQVDHSNQEALEDSILDAIAYLAFVYSWLHDED
jgi:hypothetical protein